MNECHSQRQKQLKEAYKRQCKQRNYTTSAPIGYMHPGTVKLPPIPQAYGNTHITGAPTVQKTILVDRRAAVAEPYREQ